MESDSEKENEDIPEFPEVTEAVSVEFVESQRGGRLLIDPYNYVYEKHAKGDERLRWRCTRFRSKLYPW
jgi:hypothetical protein